MAIRFLTLHYSKFKKKWKSKENLSLFSLISLFNGIYIFMGYLMPKPFLLKNSISTI